MDGAIRKGFYRHPQLGLIRISERNGTWVYYCYSSDGSRLLSVKPKKLDNWLWAMSEEASDISASSYE